MRNSRKAIVGLCLGAGMVLFATLLTAQQDKAKRPSPPATASFDLGGGKSITIEYSSPRVKGRKIFGEVVPFGKEWRTGANEATTFVTTSDLTVGGAAVPAGSYAIYTIPNKDKWTLIISKKIPSWGTQVPEAADELARVDMKVTTLSAPVENFTISFDKAPNGATLNLDWETTRASVAIAKK